MRLTYLPDEHVCRDHYIIDRLAKLIEGGFGFCPEPSGHPVTLCVQVAQKLPMLLVALDRRIVAVLLSGLSFILVGCGFPCATLVPETERPPDLPYHVSCLIE